MKSGPLSGQALHGRRAVVEIHDRLYQSEPQARAAQAAPGGLPGIPRHGKTGQR